jgi:tRNA (cmo5U34)-methyltransferase
MREPWSDTKHVAEYLAREIPHRDIAERMLLDTLPSALERLIDLGTGDGRLIASVRAQRRNVHCLGLDRSQPMLKLAAERFAEDPLVEIAHHDLIDPLPKRTPVGAVVSGLAIHHLPDQRKQTLFGEIYALLEPGGVFANLDLTASPTPQMHERFRQAIGRHEDDPSDLLAPVCEQLAWLEQAGFEGVDCHFKWLELALIVARRPL